MNRSSPRRQLSLLVCALLLPSCGGCGEKALELVQARDEAAEHAIFQKEGWAAARRVLEPIVAEEDAAAEDLLRMACVMLGKKDWVDEAVPLVDRAAKLLPPDDPLLRWCRFRIERLRYENEKAMAELREVRRLVPDDILVGLTLGCVLADLAQDSQDPAPYAAEAERELEAFLALPGEYTGTWRFTAVHRLAQLLQRLDRAEEAKPYFDEERRFQDQGIESPGEPEHQPNTLGEVRPHSRSAFGIPRPVSPATPAIEEVPGSAGSTAFAVGRFAPERERDDITAALGGLGSEELWRRKIGPPQLVLGGPTGVRILHRDPDGSWSVDAALLEKPVRAVIPFDRGNRSTEPQAFNWRREGQALPNDPKSVDDPHLNADLDLWVVMEGTGGQELRAVDHRGEVWTLLDPLLSPPGTIEPERIVLIDLDHEGDLDLVVGTDGGPRLFRNDDFNVSATGMVEVTSELPLPAGEFVPIPEDFDRDGDVDLLFAEAGSGRLHLLSSDRGWRFVDETASLPAVSGSPVLLEDLDGSGFPDVAAFGDALRVVVRDLAGYASATLEWPLAAKPSGPPLAVDWDLDGTTDLLWPTAGGGAAGILAPGFAEGGVPIEILPSRSAGGVTERIAVADLDLDFDPDLLVLDGNGVRIAFQPGAGPGAGKGFELDLRGYKDNARGVGATVELREGYRYRRLFWRGEPQLLGMGGGDPLDVLRITWPTAVIQNHLGVPGGAHYLLWERPGIPGSCPFLYTWNGTTYEFVSDVLGITPLGLPMAPGELVPPDHDEYVLVHGEQLVPKDGFYELQLTEELREVTYLDRIRLDVVDHPADVEIFPNERFSFPPFPEPHTYTVKDPLVPLSARDGDGADWTSALAANDRSFAFPFRPLRGQFQGLAEPYTIELAFEAERVRAAKELRLVMNGWFFWTDASVNLAAARSSEAEFIPPILQVPAGNGGWRDAGPPLGFPAGKLKTMVVDVTELLNRDDPRLRLFSTLRLYWDSIRLAVDDDDAPTVTTSIEPASAVTWERGFSRPIPLPGLEHEPELEWFAWDALASEPRWNQHPGLYTRYGESLPLLTAIDDLFVVMGAGDALTVRFDASAAPALAAGWKRDFLVFLDGWAKDRDPNTLEALHVEPFPFHGMSGYPYGPEEHFPDDPAQRAWRSAWLTRETKRWIPSLVPPRLASDSPPAEANGELSR